jgi:hypothetical protein
LVEISTAEQTGIHVAELEPATLREESPRVRRALVAAFAAMAAAAGVTGCETLRQPEEMAWQALHVADVGQTLKIPGSPCLREGHPITSLLIGRQPTKAGVLAWGAASAGVHLLISDQLAARGMDRAYAVWQFVSIGDSAASVGRNHGIGIRIGTRNVGRAACTP